MLQGILEFLLLSGEKLLEHTHYILQHFTLKFVWLLNLLLLSNKGCQREMESPYEAQALAQQSSSVLGTLGTQLKLCNTYTQLCMVPLNALYCIQILGTLNLQISPKHNLRR